MTSVAFSADGKWLDRKAGMGRLASVSNRKTVKVWDTTSGHQTITLKGDTDSIFGVAFSPDGEQLRLRKSGSNRQNLGRRDRKQLLPARCDRFLSKCTICQIVSYGTAPEIFSGSGQ